MCAANLLVDLVRMMRAGRTVGLGTGRIPEIVSESPASCTGNPREEIWLPQRPPPGRPGFPRLLRCSRTCPRDHGPKGLKHKVDLWMRGVLLRAGGFLTAAILSG